jgi:hypothetical protein
MEKLMHLFIFNFIACREFSKEKAGGWHFHFITHKQNLPFIGEHCEFHIEPPKWDDSFDKALTYLCKEDVKECTADDFSRSSKMYFQKNDANTAFFKLIKRNQKVELIIVPQQIELTPPTAILVPQQIEITPPTAILGTQQIEITPQTRTLGQSLKTLESWAGAINWVSYFRPIKSFFQQLFIKINKTFFKLRYGYQRENNSIARWNDDS